MKTTPFLSLIIALSFSPAAFCQEKAPLALAQTIPLADVPGGFNHMSVDAAHHRLFVPATTAKTLEIIDLDAGKPLRDLPGERPAAVLFASEFNQFYVTRGRNVCIYDGKTFDLSANVALPCGLDEMEYDPAAGLLYVGCMEAGQYAIAVIAIPGGKTQGEIKLPAKPQGFAVEQNGSRIFVNMPALNAIAVLDRKKKTLMDTWVLKGVSGNFPIALDEANHRLFVGCREPAQLLVLDAVTGKSVARVAIDGDTDDLSYDPVLKRVYIACGQGFIDVVQRSGPDTCALSAHIPVPPGSRNSFFSPKAGEYYLAVPQRGKESAEIRVFQTQ